ncbi:hypothetical protein OCK74_22090 [Chitinophagaceae bacterium LB-8]|uniref:Uncharacterized protein n=1 Tax=Paraflavisolibacter caeni TaxID=2982496 RepID=A0A9X3B9V8_9BACT|nr:hypothetical protein [Paraflavisolibacter caeni]MCU7551826.1 hypothetical protein [Paraflavisolibacter caeni]
MLQLKKISKESIPAALEKAERYRFLNEPALAESICSDILEADPQNTRAVVIMLLAITDQFGSSSEGLSQAKQLLPRLSNVYERYYYEGIICERKGKTAFDKNVPDAGFTAFEWLRDAMDCYEKAEAVRPTGNDDAILRWNTCARLIMRHHLEPRTADFVETQLE